MLSLRGELCFAAMCLTIEPKTWSLQALLPVVTIHVGHGVRVGDPLSQVFALRRVQSFTVSTYYSSPCRTARIPTQNSTAVFHWHNKGGIALDYRLATLPCTRKTRFTFLCSILCRSVDHYDTIQQLADCIF
jgi:hypothetical protein